MTLDVISNSPFVSIWKENLATVDALVIDHLRNSKKWS